MLVESGLEKDTANNYVAQRLKDRIIKHYRKKVTFAQSSRKNESQLVYNSNIGIQNVINAASELKNIYKPENLELLTDELHEEIVNDYKSNVIYHAAGILRQGISLVKGIIIEPLNPADISEKTILENLTDLLLKFLQMLCDEKERNLLKVLSIAQSITYVVSNGMKKMPKHVAIGVAKNLRAKEFITILNRHGYCISYDNCLATDAYWASEMVMNGNGYATKPTNIIPNKFTQAATDNSGELFAVELFTLNNK